MLGGRPSCFAAGAQGSGRGGAATIRPMSRWNFADVWEAVAELHPDAPALTQGSTRRTWRQLDDRANGVAATLLASGLDHQAKVAQYLYNGPEYIESLFAAFKASLVPVNTNYRYTEDELVYLWSNADVEAVVFHGAFAERAGATAVTSGRRLRRAANALVAGEPAIVAEQPFRRARGLRDLAADFR